MDLKAFIQEQITNHPIEAKIVRKVIRTLKAAGTPIVKTYDGEEWTTVSTEQEIMEVAFNLDWVRLYTEDGSWVFLVFGNEQDVIADYTMDLEETLEPVMDYIESHWD